MGDKEEVDRAVIQRKQLTKYEGGEIINLPLLFEKTYSSCSFLVLYNFNYQVTR